MRRRITWTRAGKWAGVIALGAITIVWVVSGLWAKFWVWPTARGQTAIAFIRGCVQIDTSDYPWAFGPGGWSADDRGWDVQFSMTRYAKGPGRSMARVEVPLWPAWVLLAIPTAFLWRLDRRRPAGACVRCGYDLAGNTTGVCPECGKAKPA